jgi:NAD(P)-dependent dehydrogenase (short-subunit alcohol dehydrogenase family)
MLETNSTKFQLTVDERTPYSVNSSSFTEETIMVHAERSHTPLTGKVAFITGGSRGIGAAIAKRLAADGASVAITYNASADNAQDVVRAIEGGQGRAVAIKADAGDHEAVRSAVIQAAGKFGSIDILVNNAGIGIHGAPEDIDFADYQRIIAVNITGMFVATQETLRHMPKGGRIVQIGSTMTRYAGFSTASLYTLTKGAITGFARGLVRDLGPRGITVNTVHPGPTDTDLNPADGPIAKFVKPQIAVQRYGHVEDIADAVAYLAGPRASFVTGAELVVDGGFTA